MNKNIAPRVLMADAAAAIHKKDLSRIHFLSSEKEFDEAIKLFAEKWAVEERGFVEYFDANWVNRNYRILVSYRGSCPND